MEVVIPVGLSVQLDPGQPPPDVQVVVEATPHNGPQQTYASAREVTAEFVQGLCDDAQAMRGEPGAFEPVRPYIDIGNKLAQAPGNRYFEVTIPGQVYGDVLTYRVKYIVDGITGSSGGTQPNNQQPQRFRLVLLDPQFGPDDIRFVQAPDHESNEHWWTLSYRSEQGYDCLRMDMLTTVYDQDSFRLPCVKLTLPNGSMMDLGVVQTDPTAMPLIDRNTDTIKVFLPQGPTGPLGSITVSTGFDPSQQRSTNVNVAGGQQYWPTRLLLINFCIQGLNDLFAPPLDAYTPSRTYAQVTMRDENSKYCSRPEQTDSGLPDGYGLTLDAQRYYGVKTQWAFNAGVLHLIAHDSPQELQNLRHDIQTKLVVPCNAGFGAHRPPYYTKGTNTRELQAGKKVIQNVLGYTGSGLDVYYPDQRLFEGGANELDAYQAAGIEFLVFDRSTVCSGPANNPVALFQGPNVFNGNYLWRLKNTNIGILLIDDDFRNFIDGATDDERQRGQMAVFLRRRFMQLVTPRNAPHRPLMVYGDDADKASGCGWFDGNYDGHKVHFNDEYQADLCWISSHPWVQAITTEDLNVAADSAGDQEITSATCPSVDPGGAITVDQYGSRMHFDQWYKAWQAFEASWLGVPLDQLSTTLETALVNWAAGAQNELYELAWLYFLMCTHESFWNKEPLEQDPNTRRGVLEPEDFVLAESLEQRHAWVYLNASLWAGWASAQAAPAGPFLDSGPVVNAAQAANSAPAAIVGGQNGLFWDHDLLQNAILYNEQVLLVMDRNGGCIANIFVMLNGRPVSVSGHFKAFQYLDTSRTVGSDPGTISDGEVFQNTVFTPNHAYVASDVTQSQPLVGTYYDPRAPSGPQQQWSYPNNFNEYDYTAQAGSVAQFRYQAGTGVPTAQLNRDSFRAACVSDRDRRTAGQPGVVWHDASTPAFTKTVALQGRTVKVSYSQAPASHVVANEFCMDLYTAIYRAAYQTKQVDPNGAFIKLSGPGGSEVTVTVGNNCRFVDAALTPAFAAAVASDAVSEYVDLHRVLTDNLQIICPHGGDFDYTIEFA